MSDQLDGLRELFERTHARNQQLEQMLVASQRDVASASGMMQNMAGLLEVLLESRPNHMTRRTRRHIRDLLTAYEEGKWTTVACPRCFSWPSSDSVVT